MADNVVQLRNLAEWRSCARFPDYEVCESGEVRRWKRGHGRGVAGLLMRPYLDRSGYVTYRLRVNSKYRHVRAHQLVAEAFIGPKPFDGAEVCHNDGVKTNISPSNLRWDTHRANMLDRDCRGEANGQAKITSDDVVQIRNLWATGALQREIAEQFGLSRPTVSMIVNRVNWSHVQ